MPTVPRTEGYSTTEDLLLGNIPLPTFLDADKMILDSADEIDSVVGFLYTTPLDLSDSSDMVKPARLLVKRISNWLSTGRIIMAVAAGGEQQQVHAYGYSLVKQAEDLLRQISMREIILDGATPVDGAEDVFVGPQIHNVDGESNVEAFYDRVANPTWPFGSFGDSETRNGLIR